VHRFASSNSLVVHADSFTRPRKLSELTPRCFHSSGFCNPSKFAEHMITQDFQHQCCCKYGAPTKKWHGKKTPCNANLLLALFKTFSQNCQKTRHGAFCALATLCKSYRQLWCNCDLAFEHIQSCPAADHADSSSSSSCMFRGHNMKCTLRRLFP
jgi:hypothetical protein